MEIPSLNGLLEISLMAFLSDKSRIQLNQSIHLFDAFSMKVDDLEISGLENLTVRCRGEMKSSQCGNTTKQLYFVNIWAGSESFSLIGRFRGTLLPSAPFLKISVHPIAVEMQFQFLPPTSQNKSAEIVTLFELKRFKISKWSGVGITSLEAESTTMLQYVTLKAVELVSRVTAFPSRLWMDSFLVSQLNTALSNWPIPEVILQILINSFGGVAFHC